MKYHLSCTIVQNTSIVPQHYELIVTAPDIARLAKPGNFVQIKVDYSLNPLLPRPMGISYIDKKKGLIGVIYKIFGKGTTALSHKKPGENVILTGPLGNSFCLDEKISTVAFVAGGTGVGPILLLADNWSKEYPNLTIFVFLGARTKKLFIGLDRLEKKCSKVYSATDDGSFGHHGFITDILEKSCTENGIQHIFAVGPIYMMKKAFDIGKNLGLTVDVSLEERMACGFGVCLGCACKMKDGKYHMICIDGPIVNAYNVTWEAFE